MDRSSLAFVFPGPSHCSVNPATYEHIFSGHLLHTSQQLELQREVPTEQIWISVFLMAGIGLLSTCQNYSFRDLVRNIQAGFNTGKLRKFEYRESFRLEFQPLLLDLFFILNLAFIGLMVNKNYGFVQQGSSFPAHLFFFFVLVAVLFAMRWLGDSLLVLVSSKGRLLEEYRALSKNIDRITGLFLFPLSLMLGLTQVNPDLLIIFSIVLLSICFLTKWTRGFMLAFGEEGIGILQILTYFCGLEILPPLVVVKFVIETFKAGN